MTHDGRARIVVLASGGGSNFEAVAAHLEQLGESRRADIVAVASDRRGAGALHRARARGLEAVQLPSRMAPGGESLEDSLSRLAPDLIVLAGYLRLIPGPVVAMYRGRMVNVHPALLPAFGGPGMYGLRVHQGVLDAGVRITGATVHFVDEVFDHGAIIAQWPVPVRTGDTAAALAARVLRAEHALYPRIVHAVAAGAIGLGGDGRVRWGSMPGGAELDFAAMPAEASSTLPLRDDGTSPVLATLASLYPNL